MLKEYLINSPGWDWIERFKATENGREVFWYWLDNYNCLENLINMTHLELTTLKTLHYKKEQSMVFDKNSESPTRDFATLDKDPEKKNWQGKS